MKTKLSLMFTALTLGVSFIGARAQGTAFTYQGRLNDGANPANGIYDLRFAIYDSTNNPGILIAGPLTNSSSSVSNGLFTVTLDFGSGVFDGTPRFLEIAVRTNGGGAFMVLTPRQALTPTPYAIFANTASNLLGVVSSGQLSGPYNGPVQFNNGLDSFDGTFSGQFFGSSFIGGIFTGNFLGSGNGLIDVWHIGGNSGTTAGVNFIGTTDLQPVELKAAGQRILRLEPDPRGAAAGNLIGGFTNNVIEKPAGGGNVISGGGIGGGSNIIHSNSSGVFMGAGSANQIGPNVNDAVIVAGIGNTVSPGGYRSFIGDGYVNTIGTNSQDSFIGGGEFNSIGTNGYENVIVGGYNNVIGDNNFQSAIVGGYQNSIWSAYSAAYIGGGYQNSVSSNGYNGAIVGGYYNTNNANASFIGGGYYNFIDYGAGSGTISGGGNNTIQANAFSSTIGGGYGNLIQGGAFNSIIGGGYTNVISSNAPDATISGGQFNVIGQGASLAAISGGFGNNANGQYSFIGGGIENLAGGFLSTSVGGQGNAAAVNNSTVVGGLFNTNFGVLAFMGGGDNNFASGYASVISGGESNRAFGQFSMASGYHAGALHNGTFVWSDFEPAALNFSSTLSNQFLIRAQNGVGINTNNPQAALHVNGTIIANNFVGSGSALSGLNFGELTGTLLDGQLSGGYSGVVSFSNPSDSFTGNGSGLTALSASQLTGGPIPSGVLSGTYSSALTFNNVGNSFTGNGSGLTSLNANNISIGTVPDARLSANVAFVNRSQQFVGTNTFLTGTGSGSKLFVFGNTGIDTNKFTGLGFQYYTGTGEGAIMSSYDDGFASLSFWTKAGNGFPLTKQMVIDINGNVGIGPGAPTQKLHVFGNILATGTVTGSSDRNVKENFAPVNSREILDHVAAMPITRWNYKADAGVTHLGPMAQDFYAAFNVGMDDKHISMVDADGVALAAIQGLNQKLDEQRGELKQKETEITELKQRLEKLEEIMARQDSGGK